MELLLGDCLDRLKELEDNSVDAIVCDPPYGLSFMGKKWDYDVPSVDIWKECLRVLKPGGYLLAFAGTRTQHRMAVNIEDAGFEIRDMIFWTYASGFPKSLNIWKQLKKRCACGNMEVYEQDRNVQWVSNKQKAEYSMRPVSEANISETVNSKEEQGKVLQQSLSEQGVSVSGKASNNDGREEPSLEGGSNIQESKGELQGSDISEVSKGIPTNGEERRIHNATQVGNGSTLEQTIGEGGGSTSPRPQSQQQQDREPCAFCKQYGTQAMGALGLGSALKPACEPITVARKPISEKSLADNHLKWGVGGINIDGCRVGYTDGTTEEQIRRKYTGSNEGNSSVTNNFGVKDIKMTSDSTLIGRFPANLIHDGSEEVVGLFPQTKSGKMGPQHTRHTDGSPNGIYGKFDVNHELGETYGDSGSASRFFKTCNYSLRHDTMSVWKTTFVDTAERLLRITQVIKESIAPLNVGDLQEEQNDQLVKSAVSHADTIEILIALVLVRIKSLASNPEGLQAIQDSIGNCKECIQLLSLVLNVVNEENTDITQITTNLWTLFGSVNPAITNSTPETKKLEPKRFAYIPKASKRERNIGCEGLELTRHADRNIDDGVGGDNPRNRTNTPKQNFHPTVKPVALMEYLVKLVSREGQVVLDPFMGSGTTGMACKKLNREFIGIEMMEEYMEIAKCRIKGVKKSEQLNMI